MDRHDDEQVPMAEIVMASRDCGGWWNAWADPESSWRGWPWESGKRPRVYFPTRHRYPDGDAYLAVDGLGREVESRTIYECVIDPVTGKFRPLCVQTRDSLCHVSNVPWDRTCLRNSAPALFALATLPFSHIPIERRYTIVAWTGGDWLWVVLRWLPATLGITFLMFLQQQRQPLGKDPHAYLPFLYNGYRYPRLARNFQENKEDVRTQRPNDPSWPTGDIGVYRVLKPRRLCYLTEPDKNGKYTWYETRDVRDDDNTPYVFISYTKSQFLDEDDHNWLYLWAIEATQAYSRSVHDEDRCPKAFWLGASCLEYPEHALDEQTRKKLADHDVYSLSDVIRGAEHAIIIAKGDSGLRQWGDRVWTLPEVLLSKGDTVTVVDSGQPPIRLGKLQLAQAAWADAAYSRQLVEHFTNLHLSRLELVSIALRCLKNRKIEQAYRGDRSYALMGLLRVRPGIDCSDSSFQAFARLSLPQDNDRLMERLICLLPQKPDEPWDAMTDKYDSTLWDIYPDTQVCGVGENDTIIVDGFKGAMIQWSMFSTVQTRKRLTRWRTILLVVSYVSPWLFYIGAIVTSIMPRSPWITLLIVPLAILLVTPLYVPTLFTGKLTEVEPCLFGIEGYLPLPVIEESLFGAKMDRLKWSANGSPLSRHRYRRSYRERHCPVEAMDEESAPLAPQSTTTTEEVWTYPVEALDPCAVCPQCSYTGADRVRECQAHPTPSSLDAESRSEGGMKVFTLVDTYSMTATLFRAYRPPVMLMVGGSEGGMKRALACSYDVTTGTLYRETVFRMPSRTVDCMHSLPRVRLGLKNPRNEDVKPRLTPAPVPSTMSSTMPPAMSPATQSGMSPAMPSPGYVQPVYGEQFITQGGQGVEMQRMNAQQGRY